MVLRKIGTDSRFFSTDGFYAGGDANEPSIGSAFKLSDGELHYMTSANPRNWGVLLVPNYDNGRLVGNLLRTSEADRAYPIGGSTGANQGDMAKSALDASDYPTSWDHELETNSHCGGTQVWANWVSTESYKFRYTSAGGCSYFDESLSGVSTGDYGGSIWGFVGGGAPSACRVCDGSSASEPLAHVGKADSVADGDYWIMTSAASAKRLRIVHHAGKAWAMVLRKIGTDSRFFSTDGFYAGGDANEPSIGSAFKLSDGELHYMTSANPRNWGVLLVPNYDNGRLVGNLLRTSEADRAYPIGGSTGANQGDMAKSALDASDYPTSWDHELETNSHCGGTQVWANWVSTESYKFRYTSAGGCSYFDESLNGVSTGDYGGSVYGFVH